MTNEEYKVEYHQHFKHREWLRTQVKLPWYILPSDTRGMSVAQAKALTKRN